MFASNGGNLLCKKVIHAVGPRWMSGNENEDNDLYDAIYNSLMEADSHKLTSIAIPPVSGGIFGFPLNKCVATIVDAVNNYFTETTETNLTKVYLVSIKQEEVDAFSNSLLDVYGNMAQKPNYELHLPKHKKGKVKYCIVMIVYSILNLLLHFIVVN